MMVRGGGIPTCFLGFRRKGEWVRRFGASLPMRMAASWFGSWTHRIQGCGAIDPRPKAGSPLIVIPRPDQMCRRARNCEGVALARRSSATLARQPTLTLPARSRRKRSGSEQRNGLSDRTKKPTKRKKTWRNAKLLDKKSPIQGNRAGGTCGGAAGAMGI
jgi:hypothetical protein